MTPAVQLEILDLRHFSAGNLKPVLEAESLVWSSRLRWDFRSSANLLLQYLDSHLLPGYVALKNGRVRGYAFCVYEGNKAVLGDVFAIPSDGEPDSGREIEHNLLEHIVQLLQHSPDVDRIEAQLLLHPHGTHSESLARNRFRIYERLFMELDLRRQAPAAMALPPDGLQARVWRDTDFNAAGQLICQAYQGHLDSLINDQYRSITGSLRFLHNIVRFPGCGIFDPEASCVLLSPKRDELVGLLLCSRVQDQVGHVTQICVSPQYQRRGAGSWLLAECSRVLKERNFQALSLTVTKENSHAVSLYRQSGFETRHTFDAMVWNLHPEREI